MSTSTVPAESVFPPDFVDTSRPVRPGLSDAEVRSLEAAFADVCAFWLGVRLGSSMAGGSEMTAAPPALTRHAAASSSTSGADPGPDPRPTLYPAGLKVSPGIAAHFAAWRGADAREALDQFRTLAFSCDDVVELLVGGNAVEPYAEDVEAAWSAIRHDAAGRAVALCLAGGQRTTIALEVPGWSAAGCGRARGSATAVVRSANGEHTFAVWSCSRELASSKLDEIARGLCVAFGGEAFGVRRAYAVPIAGTGAADDTRWTFASRAPDLTPRDLARVAGVRGPVLAIAPQVTVPAIRGAA